jgi:PAS domain S-box-containing protein
MVDRQYMIQSANKAFCRSVNLPEGQVLGRRCYEVSHHCNKPCFEAGEECAIKLTFETGAPHAVSHTHVSDNGMRYHVEIKSYPITDASGNVVSVIETIKDVTEEKKLEEQLRHAQKMEAIGTLAGGIAHDFNNILNVILGYGSMMLNRLGDDQLSREQLNEVLAAADRAANLTKRLLAFSRKQVVDIKPVNGNEIIFGLEKMLSRIIGEDIDFALELSEMAMIVMADTGQIEQVLMNLATNARDAMPEGGRLTIGTGLAELDDEYVAAYGYGKPGKYFLITISDTGHGIEAETQKNIFEPFFTTKGIGEGTGLGLAISYGIIKQHNGYIMVSSEPGKGTTFQIYLPLIEDSIVLGKQAENPVAFKGGNETILVAEDDVSIRELLKIVLESFGYTVITALDGEEAIAKFIENSDKIQLAIIDMIMPKKNGKEVTDVIWEVYPLTKILFMSGYAIDTIKTRELTESGSAFIGKPIRPQELLKKVREVLDR